MTKTTANITKVKTMTKRAEARTNAPKGTTHPAKTAANNTAAAHRGKLARDK